MKIAENPRIDLLYMYDALVIPFEKGQHSELLELIDSLEIDPNKDYTVKIEPIRKKRSLDANAYFWVLVKELASKMQMPYQEVYRKCIREYGTYEVMPIRNDAVKRWCENWASNGTGWVTDILGESKINGYTNVRCFYGSKVYNTKEMARLIDGIIEMCKEQGISVMSKVELERLKNEWNVR